MKIIIDLISKFIEDLSKNLPRFLKFRYEFVKDLVNIPLKTLEEYRKESIQEELVKDAARRSSRD